MTDRYFRIQNLPQFIRDDRCHFPLNNWNVQQNIHTYMETNNPPYQYTDNVFQTST